MKIFYYTWFENSENDMMEALTRLGHVVVKCHIPLKNYEEDEEFTANLERIFQEHQCEIFLSFDFFPIIAKSAERLKKRYLAWIYDMPHLSLFSPAVQGEYTSVFVFDKVQYEQLKPKKPEHLYHLPLPVNTTRLNHLLGTFQKEAEYQQEISFVGSLYEKNMYQQINYLPDYLRGYINGVAEAQQKIYGYNLVQEVLTDEIIEQLKAYVHMEIDPSYFVTTRQLYADMINAEITHRERKVLLSQLAKTGRFTLYTGSDSHLIPGANNGGVVSYDTQMPQVFRGSKINLNITLRSIVSGIPLRALDIMGAGGFLLSNYQPELAEYFVDGQEVVLFESMEDMLAKVDYYLQHEEERKEIAYRGWKKVQEAFSYDVLLKKIFNCIM